MQERLGLSLESHRAGLGGWQLNNIVSVPQEIRGGFDLMARNTEQDWANIAGRLFNVPQAITGFVQTLHTARVAGHVSPRRQIEIVIEQIAAYIAEGGFFDELAAEITQAVPDLAEQARRSAKRQRWVRHAQDVFARGAAPGSSPAGCGRPQTLCPAFSGILGGFCRLDETYAWGVQELDRIIAQQRQVAEEIEPGASIERAKEILDADPSRTLHGTDALREWMQSLSDRAVHELAGTQFDLDGPMLRLECRIAPTHEGGIYYTAPSPDFSRPGRMWWSVPKGDDTFGTWRETSTVYHEGVPGASSADGYCAGHE